MRVKIQFELNGEYYCVGCGLRMSASQFSASHIDQKIKQCRKCRTSYMKKYNNEDPLRNLRLRTQIEERKVYGTTIIGIEDSDVITCLEKANYLCEKTNVPLIYKTARIMRANPDEKLDLETNFRVVMRDRIRRH